MFLVSLQETAGGSQSTPRAVTALVAHPCPCSTITGDGGPRGRPTGGVILGREYGHDTPSG